MGPIAIDYTPALEQGAGIGRYVRELTSALAAQDSTTSYRLFAAGSYTLPPEPGPNFTWKPARLSTTWFARLWHRARLPLNVNHWVGKDITLYHATDFNLPPVNATTRTILTIHDLAFLHAPETAHPALLKYLKAVVPRFVARADRIITVSNSAREDVINAYNIAPDKVHTVYNAVTSEYHPIEDVQAFRDKYYLGTQPFVLSVGTVQPRKNYARLAEAIKPLGVPLVIAGGKGWLEDELYKTIAQLNMGEQVRFLGYVPDEDLPYLYNAAHVFAWPSLYEGFGIPILEAMACGTPVVTSDVSSMPEVAGDAALLVDPTNTEAIRYAIQHTFEDTELRKSLRKKGLAQAQKFTWSQSANQLLQHYSDLS